MSEGSNNSKNESLGEEIREVMSQLFVDDEFAGISHVQEDFVEDIQEYEVLEHVSARTPKTQLLPHYQHNLPAKKLFNCKEIKL